MSFALLPIAYEPHLTEAAGIWLGPVYGFIAGLIFRVLRRLMGCSRGTAWPMYGFAVVSFIVLFGAQLCHLIRQPATWDRMHGSSVYCHQQARSAQTEAEHA